MRYENDIMPWIPANKFSPPRSAGDRILHRAALVKEDDFQYTIIVAQPGQGKTTTAIQFLAASATTFIWYQIGFEDRDPFYFLAALLEGIRRTYTDFCCGRLTALLETAALSSGDITRPVNILFTDLKTHLDEEDCRFVFDDLHMLDDAPQTLAILDYMLETAPVNISFLLLSRRPLALHSKRLRFGPSTRHLGNSDLAFSRKETGQLLEILEKAPPDPRTIGQLFQQSRGWVLGLVMAISNRSGSDHVSKRYLDKQMTDFFEDEVLGHFDEELQRILITLSLFDVIDVQLAAQVTGNREIGTVLRRLMSDNCFIRSLDDQDALFSFHHHFRSILRKKAEQHLTAGEHDAVLQQAADFFLQQGMLAEPLRYLLRAGLYSELEQLLSQRGMELVFSNRLEVLDSLMRALPLECIARSAWFSLFKAFVVQQRNPPASRQFFVQARSLFHASDQAIGELVALGELIYYHLVLAPDSRQCNELISAADHLFQRHGHELPLLCRTTTAKNIGLGCFYFLNDFKRANRYLKTAELDCLETGSPSQLLEVMVAQGLARLYPGDFTTAEILVEKIYAMMISHDCSLRSMMVSYYYLLQVQHLKGDYQGYRRLLREVRANIDKCRLRATIVHPYIILYSISVAIAEGDLDRAMALVVTNQDRGFFQTVTHLRHELLANKTLLLAWSGQYKSRGRAIAEELYPIVDQDVTLGYRLKILFPLAMAEAVSNNFVKARMLVEHLFNLSRDTIPMFEIYARLIRVYIATCDHDTVTIDQDLDVALRHMQHHDFHHVRCFSPRELLPVLQTAVRRNIYPDYVRRIAAQYLRVGLEHDGSPVPLLHITTLGSFALKLEGRRIAGASDFTVNLRQLLGLLISRPRLEMGQEQVQTILWPDASPAKARNRFDVLLARIRKILKPLVADIPVKKYMVLEKGVLALRNCTVDACLFSDLVRQGLKASRERNWYRMGNAFASAMELWAGPYVLDLLPGEDSSGYAWTLQQQLTFLGLTWCPFLAEKGQLDRAIQVAARVWQQNPVDEQLTHQLYHLYLLNNETVQATILHQRYEQLLVQEEYPKEEILELLARIRDPSGISFING